MAEREAICEAVLPRRPNMAVSCQTKRRWSTELPDAPERGILFIAQADQLIDPGAHPRRVRGIGRSRFSEPLKKGGHGNCLHICRPRATSGSILMGCPGLPCRARYSKLLVFQEADFGFIG